jgi:poly-gamma-glutamate capsule biosynthesis protein CapA/YwtB (metallophosphatase superfamily)
MKYYTYYNSLRNNNRKIYPVLSNEEIKDIGTSVKLLYTGDLILLADQVQDARSDNGYEFDSIFENAKKYIADADLTIGVFEGPCAGEKAGYTVSRFGNGSPHDLNFPDSFAEAIKKAGFDLVTTSNNHLLDQGIDGALRTLDILDRVGLEHIGSYRTKQEKNTVKILDIKGIKIAFLAYTLCDYFFAKGYTEKGLLEGDESYITSFLVSPKSPYFQIAREKVRDDFKRVKDKNPDMIIVLPHMGTVFSHKLNAYQEVWNKIFVDAGADIVLGDHVHVVQPIQFINKSVIVNCPGHFVDSYRWQNSDASAMVEIYLSHKKDVWGVSIIPMWVKAQLNGNRRNYRPLPIYDILTNESLQDQISTYELDRVKEVHQIITEVMLDEQLDIDMITSRYFLTRNGLACERIRPLEITDEQKASTLYKLLSGSDTVCFIGDDITEGTRNGGYGWFEPIIENFTEKMVIKKAWGAGTVQVLLKNIDAIAKERADLYIIAIGTNDIRYNEINRGRYTAGQYIADIQKITVKIKQSNENAHFVFINPWLILDDDPILFGSIPLNRKRIFEEYGTALEQYCYSNDCYYINPNLYIDNIISRNPRIRYLVDCMHPGKSKGIYLYSEAVLSACKNIAGGK